MAVTFLERPTGYVIQYPAIGSSVISSNGGDAEVFNSGNHGLVDGDIIYLHSTVDSYNGFWKVDVSSATRFRLQDILTNAYVPFVKLLDSQTDPLNLSDEYLPYFNYYNTLLSHHWSCVHLPITYKIESNLHQVSDAFATVDAFTNSSGNTSLTFTGAFSGSGLSATNTHVKIVGSSVDGIYRIIDTTVTLIIDLPYNVTNILAGAVVYVYYNNYHVRVQVYGGLTTAHYWEDEKPYELISTLKLIPDNNNEIKFSIANELKKQVKSLNNNLSLDTLPNNIDAFTMFYITTQESYDYNDSGDIITHTEGILVDKNNFEGFAVNAKLPFKNINSGFLGDYLVDEASTAAKFLTLFETPVMFDGYYFDISVLLNFLNIIYYDLPVLYFKQKWLNASGTAIAQQDTIITNYDAGLYRLSITPDCDYSQLQISIGSGSSFSQMATIDGWNNTIIGAFNGNWEWRVADGGSSNANTIGSAGTKSKYLLQPNNIPSGILINIQCEFDVDPADGSSAGLASFDIVIVNETTIVFTTSTTVTGTGTYTINQNIVIPSYGNNIGYTCRSIVATAQYQFYVKYFRVSELSEISETKTIDIACNCNDQGIEGTQLTWLNYLGGMEYFVFTAQTEHQIDIKEAKTRLINIFPTWPNSYGEGGQTMRQETSRVACFRKTLRSQLISNENLQAMQYLKTSPLVQIMVSQTDLRTVLVDTDSFTVYNDNDKEFSISFAVEYTDYIPAQSL
jgi:hypothetical protein